MNIKIVKRISEQSRMALFFYKKSEVKVEEGEE
jgi:hypothetical protein